MLLTKKAPIINVVSVFFEKVLRAPLIKQALCYNMIILFY